MLKFDFARRLRLPNDDLAPHVVPAPIRSQAMETALTLLEFRSCGALTRSCMDVQMDAQLSSREFLLAASNQK